MKPSFPVTATAMMSPAIYLYLNMRSFVHPLKGWYGGDKLMQTVKTPIKVKKAQIFSQR